MRFLLCDDHAIFREGLRVVLSEMEADLIEVETVEAAVDQIAIWPDVDLVLMDLRMPGTDGFTGLRHIREQHPDVPVVIVSASESPTDVREALRGGAAGFIPKSSKPALLRSAISVVLSGGVYIPPQVMALDEAAVEDPEPAGAGRAAAPVRRADPSPLTPRQLQVLRLMARGLTNREIANVLAIAEGTVKTHVRSVMDALDVTNRTEAALVMREMGLDESDD